MGTQLELLMFVLKNDHITDSSAHVYPPELHSMECIAFWTGYAACRQSWSQGSCEEEERLYHWATDIVEQSKGDALKSCFGHLLGKFIWCYCSLTETLVIASKYPESFLTAAQGCDYCGYSVCEMLLDSVVVFSFLSQSILVTFHFLTCPVVAKMAPFPQGPFVCQMLLLIAPDGGSWWKILGGRTWQELQTDLVSWSAFSL